MKKLLLDTHIWIWALMGRARLAPRVAKELSNPGNELWLSPISIWELLLLEHKGTPRSGDPRSWLVKALAAVPVLEAPLTFEIAQEAGKIRLPHRDFANHFLVATAKVLELTLVTADRHLVSSRAVAILRD